MEPAVRLVPTDPGWHFMPFGLLADLVLLLHFAFILFVIFGALLLVRWPRLVWLHLSAVVWAAVVIGMGWICPLTPLENWLRRQAGEGGYPGGFIEHYLMPLIYPPGLTPAIQIFLSVLVVLVNIGFYVMVWKRGRRRLP